MRHVVLKEMVFEEFPNGCNGGHLVDPNETIKAILNLHVALMSFTKFWFNLKHGFGEYVV